jgi:hypothetical protein
VVAKSLEVALIDKLKETKLFWKKKSIKTISKKIILFYVW